MVSGLTVAERARKELEAIRKVSASTTFIYALFGGGKKLKKRRAIAKTLLNAGLTALVPEDDFPRGALGTYELPYLCRNTIDLAFIFPESLGSATEFGQFAGDIEL